MSRFSREIALAAAALLALGVLTWACIVAGAWLSARWSLACHRLIPAAPTLPRPGGWRVGRCLERPSPTASRIPF